MLILRHILLVTMTVHPLAGWCCEEMFFDNATAEKVRQCFKSGLDVRYRDASGNTLLHLANRAIPDLKLEIFVRLLIAGTNPRVVNEEGQSALHLAAAKPVEPVAALLAFGVDLNGLDHNGSTPLAVAAASRNIPVVKLLLADGADPQIGQFNGRSTTSWLNELIASGEFFRSATIDAESIVDAEIGRITVEDFLALSDGIYASDAACERLSKSRAMPEDVWYIVDYPTISFRGKVSCAITDLAGAAQQAIIHVDCIKPEFYQLRWRVGYGTSIRGFEPRFGPTIGGGQANIPYCAPLTDGPSDSDIQASALISGLTDADQSTTLAPIPGPSPSTTYHLADGFGMWTGVDSPVRAGELMALLAPYLYAARTAYPSTQTEWVPERDWRQIALEEMHAPRSFVKAMDLAGFDASFLMINDVPYLAFAGSNSLNDYVFSNIPNLAVGSEYTGPHSFALSLTEHLKAEFPDLVLTGHSLGGGMAAYAGAMSQSPTVTFNPASVVRAPLPDRGEEFVLNLIFEGGGVSFGINVGQTIIVDQDTLLAGTDPGLLAEFGAFLVSLPGIGIVYPGAFNLLPGVGDQFATYSHSLDLFLVLPTRDLDFRVDTDGNAVRIVAVE